MFLMSPSAKKPASMKNAPAKLLLLVFFFGTTALQAQSVTIVGQMKDVMWKGQLQGKINLDSLDASHLYGLGPVAYLAGEILVLDGQGYQSTAVDSENMLVENTLDIKAPFFGYAHIPQWKKHPLPTGIQKLDELEAHLDELARDLPQPFFFRLTGTIASADVHIVNLPAGTTVRSPQDAHQGQVNYGLGETEVEILGFYSTTHQGILTHHDTHLHLHLITADRQRMGHVDKLQLKGDSWQLYLPKN